MSYLCRDAERERASRLIVRISPSPHNLIESSRIEYYLKSD